MGYVRAYEAGDEMILAPLLRRADLQEIEACSNRSPVDCLREGADASVPSCTIIGNHGVVAGMFGVVPEDNGYGRIWLMGTDELVSPSLRRQFLRECKSYLAALDTTYAATGNLIDARNTVHRRWLLWMGYTFLDQIPEYGILKLPFIPFIREREHD